MITKFHNQFLLFEKAVKEGIPLYLRRAFVLFFFLFSIHLFYTYIGTYNQLSARPSSIHVWAQCARASVALNYYDGDMNFFKPKIHRSIDGEGVTGLEFPFVNYVPAVCYKLFGFNEAYYRGFVLLCMALGLLFFYLMLNRVTENPLLSFALTLSAYCSPVFLYYSNNFMPDIPSIGFTLIAWYFLFSYVRSSQESHRKLYLFLVFATLAALIKATSLVTILTVFGMVVLDYLKFYKTPSQQQLFLKKPRVIICLLIGIASVFAWYFWAHLLEQHYKSASFAMSPVMVSDWATAREVWEIIYNNHRFEYYPYETYVFFIVVIALLVIGWKFVSRVYFSAFFIATIGNMFAVYFFFYQFKDHDYYIIPLTSSVFLMYLVFADAIKHVSSKYLSVLPYLFVAVLFFNLKEGVKWTRKDYQNRYNPDNVRYFDNTDVYNDLEPKLRKLGIGRNDKVLSGFETGWCNSLYKMNQMGFVFTTATAKEEMAHLLSLPQFKYMVVSDTVKYNHMFPGMLNYPVIASHRGLLIYKLR